MKYFYLTLSSFAIMAADVSLGVGALIFTVLVLFAARKYRSI